MSKLQLLQLEDEVPAVEIEASGTTENQAADIEPPKAKKVKTFPADTHTMDELTEKQQSKYKLYQLQHIVKCNIQKYLAPQLDHHGAAHKTDDQHPE